MEESGTSRCNCDEFENRQGVIAAILIFVHQEKFREKGVKSLDGTQWIIAGSYEEAPNCLKAGPLGVTDIRELSL